MKLLNLEISSFRGATKPVKIDFDRQKKITMIFGENGNGKSTISDALVCLLSSENKLGSLDDRSSEAREKQYIVSSPCKANELEIKLTTDIAVFTGSFNGKKNSWISSVGTGKPEVFHLRRKQLSEVIDEIPSERYKRIAKYINVDKVESCELQLKSLGKSLKESVDRDVSNLVQAQSTLQRIWEAENRPSGDCMVWATQEQGKNLEEERNLQAVIRTILDCWLKIDTVLDEVRRATDDANAAHAVLESARQKLAEERTSEENSDAALIKLLQGAQSFLNGKEQVDECPVCCKTNSKAELVSSIEIRLGAALSIQRLLVSISESELEYSSAKSVLDNAYLRLHNYLKLLGRSYYEGSMELADDLQQATLDIQNEDDAIARSYFKQHLTLLKADRAGLQSRSDQIERTIRQYNHISEQYNSIMAAESQLEFNKLVLEGVEHALRLVADKRKSFIESELRSIGADIQSMYSTLHPGESIGGLSLSLDDKKSASLGFSAEFYGLKDIDPQGLYSESHLDTLGICVFIALAKKYGGNEKVLILDDVVMSVDHKHLARFIELVNEQARNFTHILLTTHYQPWRNLYKSHRIGSGNIHFIELKPWTITNGIRIQSFRLDYDDLKHTIEAQEFSRQDVAVKSGIFLENMLDFLAHKYGCRLRITPDNKHTLKEYLNCFGKKLLPALQVEHLVKDYTTGEFVLPSDVVKLPLKDVIDELNNIVFIRNEVGAHFNLDSHVTDSEVEQFGRLTLKLADLLICPETGSLPIRENSGSYHATPNGSIRLHPLKEPS